MQMVAPPDGFAACPKLSFFVAHPAFAQMWFEGECFGLFLSPLCHSQISMQSQAVISGSLSVKTNIPTLIIIWVTENSFKTQTNLKLKVKALFPIIGCFCIPAKNEFAALVNLGFLILNCWLCSLYVVMLHLCVLCNWTAPNAFCIKIVCTTMSFSFHCRLGNKLVELQGRKIWTRLLAIFRRKAFAKCLLTFPGKYVWKPADTLCEPSN